MSAIDVRSAVAQLRMTRVTDSIIIIISRLLKVDKRNHNTMRKKRK